MAASGVAVLVATPLSVGWGALARGLFGLPEGMAMTQPAFLLVATGAVSSIVAVAFVLSARFAPEPLAPGLVGAGLLLALTLPAWLVGARLAYPGVPQAATVGLVTHLLVAGVTLAAILVAFRDREERRARQAADTLLSREP